MLAASSYDRVCLCRHAASWQDNLLVPLLRQVLLTPVRHSHCTLREALSESCSFPNRCHAHCGCPRSPLRRPHQPTLRPTASTSSNLPSHHMYSPGSSSKRKKIIQGPKEHHQTDGVTPYTYAGAVSFRCLQRRFLLFHWAAMDPARVSPLQVLSYMMCALLFPKAQGGCCGTCRMWSTPSMWCMSTTKVSTMLLPTRSDRLASKDSSLQISTKLYF
jgi:hypothetical protein